MRASRASVVPVLPVRSRGNMPALGVDVDGQRKRIKARKDSRYIFLSHSYLHICRFNALLQPRRRLSADVGWKRLLGLFPRNELNNGKPYPYGLLPRKLPFQFRAKLLARNSGTPDGAYQLSLACLNPWDRLYLVTADSQSTLPE